MRILQVGKYYYPHRGGIETHLRQLSTYLYKTAKVKVVVAGQGTSGTDFLDGIEVERLHAPISLFGAPICPRLISALKSSDADIVHIHLPNPWAAMAYLLSGCKIPLVVTYHSDIVRQRLVEPAIRPTQTAFLRRANAIISTSQNLIDNSKVLRPFRDRCVVIPFGVDFNEMKTVDNEAVKSILAGHTKPIILAVGRLVNYKGFEYLVNAMVGVDATLVLVGKGPLHKVLLKTASNLGIAARVKILTNVDDVAPYYHAADIFVLPSISRNEAFGIVQIEAMAAGKPIINTLLASGVPSVSLHDVTGLTVPPANSAALTAAINLLLDDQDLRLRYGSAARERAFSEFNLDSMVARTHQVYGLARSDDKARASNRLSCEAGAGG